MMRNHKPLRQPLFWAALVFSLGLWTGVRAWRPPSWWVIAVVAFVFAASWFLRKRAWLAKAFSLGTWFLLGALLIQIRGQQPGDPRIFSLADGREVRAAVWVSGLALEGIAGTVHWLGGAQVAGAPIAGLRVAMPSLVMILASIAALALAMLAARRARWAAFVSIVLLFGVAGWIAFVPSRPHLRAGVMEMTAIDVGQGDSILLVTPEGRALLVDAGGLPLWMHSDFDIGEQVVSSYLWNRGIDHLDVVVITYPHADHPDAIKSPGRCVRTTIAWCLRPLSAGRPLCSRATQNVRWNGASWRSIRKRCC